MKPCGITLILMPLLAIAIAAPAEEAKQGIFPPMPDPRPPIYRTFSKGQKAEQDLSESIIVIAWSHPPASSDKTGYQIWGDPRILTREQLSASLKRLCETTETWPYQPHLLIIGNQWGAGRELDPLMKTLSKAHEIDTFYYGASYLFTAVAFDEEAPHRMKAIGTAIDAGIKNAEEGAAAPPAADPESKSDAEEKPKPGPKAPSP